MRQSILKNIGWLAFSNALVKPLWFVFIIIIARYLGAEDFGVYMYAISFVSVVFIFFDWGIDTYMVKELAVHPESYDRFVAHSILLKIISGILASVIGYGIASLLDLPIKKTYLILIVSAFYTLNILVLHFRYVFRAFEILKYEAISIIIERTTLFIICGAALLLAANLYIFAWTYTLSYGITMLFTASVLFVKFGKPAFKFNFNYLITKILVPSLPFGLINIFIIIYFRSATIILNEIIGKDYIIGYFNAGFRLVEAFAFIPQFIMAPIYPVFSRRLSEKEAVGDILIKIIKVILTLAILVAIPICFYQNDITPLLYGQDYAGASYAVGFTILSIIPMGVTFAASGLVAMSGRQNIYSICIGATTLGNIIANYILISLYGLKGAVFTTVLTDLSLAVINIYLVRDFIKFQDLFNLIARFIILILIVLLWSLFDNVIQVVSMRIIIAEIILITGLFLLRILSWNEIMLFFNKGKENK